MRQKKRQPKIKETHQIYPVVKTGDQAVESGIVKKSFDITSLIDEFFANQDIRQISKYVYRKGLERFVNWLEGNQIEEPAKSDVLRFKAYLQEFGLSANTINLYLLAVKRFFAWLGDLKIYPDIAKGISGLAQPRGHLRETATVFQVKEMLAQFDTSTITGKRNFAIINLMARTGLRTIEIIRANVEDIKQKSGDSVLDVQGKGRDSKDELVLLMSSSLKPILAYLKARGKSDPSDPLFCSHSDRNRLGRLTTRTISKVAKDAYRNIGFDRKRLSAHSLRHFFATESLRSGAPLLQVMEAMRHSSIETTQKYLHNLDRIEKGAERYIDF